MTARNTTQTPPQVKRRVGLASAPVLAVPVPRRRHHPRSLLRIPHPPAQGPGARLPRLHQVRRVCHPCASPSCRTVSQLTLHGVVCLVPLFFRLIRWTRGTRSGWPWRANLCGSPSGSSFTSTWPGSSGIMLPHSQSANRSLADGSGFSVFGFFAIIFLLPFKYRLF